MFDILHQRSVVSALRPTEHSFKQLLSQSVARQSASPTCHWGAFAKTTATAAKTSLENKHLANGDYFQIIASSSHPILLKEHAAKGQVEAPLKLILRMKDLLLCVHVVVKTLNLEISRCHLADYVKEL